MTISNSAGHWKRTHRHSCAHTCKRMCIHICSCTHIHTIGLQMQAHIYIHVHTHAHTPTCTHMYTYKLAYSCTIMYLCTYTGLARWFHSKESTCQCRRHSRHRFNAFGWEDPLEEEIATHSSTLAWRIPGTGEHGGLQSMRCKRRMHTHPPQSTASQSACHQRQPQETLREADFQPPPQTYRIQHTEGAKVQSVFNKLQSTGSQRVKHN